MISPDDFAFFQRFLKQRSGLVLGEDKGYLLEARLLPIANTFGVSNLGALAERLRRPGATALEEAIVDAMTTNESSFFRDKTPFEAFRALMLPTLLRKRSVDQPIRIWCAAASSGQEPYSLAILLREEAAAIAGRKVEIVATDLSQEMLKRARAGLYSQFEVQRGMPVQLLLKYFKKQGDDWQIAPELRQMVHFRSLNLLSNFSALGAFDIVFCRNVLIYFDLATKADILSRIAKNLKPDGYLVLGGAETVVGVTTSFAPVAQQRSLYSLTQGQAPRAVAAA
ncbi:CheR family methyltransferase [Afifella pfennigii]|uniref:CheR family methyltransferase n=1 Tax=Afifella pfennigii TaxID=209897 RepID=UPI000B22679A|nr:protein-glutamate O-methyltransferase [Afifella pfennigii]